ncbi:MAG: phospho-N-acetylmuramoyl-pentapeptide-transferase [Bacteroidetes bacterium]|nr:phospho-N-acetylmuramoyl-pentapeptide-transferase [Bacteroidota bacterium]MDA0937345.1 phospho-N-acetylmuramoyl-pentapeptide-transferase [Bacteroidota bacterium]MDA1344787.1 phospho-N-acetylmuramoyl-pentapeptide-transferase [Bacteroidota bacterium]
MLYSFIEYLQNQYDIPGAGLFQFLSFRALFAVVGALLFMLFFGKKIIDLLRVMQVGETIRDLGLAGQIEKAGTPTMGGIIIILGTLIPVLLIADLNNVYILLLIFTTLWMGTIGWIDDYIKIFKKDKKGLKGIFKIIGQIILGCVVGGVLYLHPEVTVRQELPLAVQQQQPEASIFGKEEKSLITTIPLLKNNEFNYADFLPSTENGQSWAWLIFIPIVVFITTAVSNGANLTDGIDGLAAGSSAIMVFALGIFAWVSGNVIFADYLNIMFIPQVGEVAVFVAGFLGALIGFLWYNTYPATIFMGDTGSLTIGALISVIAFMVRKELLIPVLCGVFVIENLSVALQVGYFKYTRKKTGVGKRLFLMAPLHHHFQKKGFHESKIVARFWIIGILLAVLSIVTLKIR